MWSLTPGNPMLGNQTIQYDLIGVNSVWPEADWDPGYDAVAAAFCTAVVNSLAGT